VDSVEDFAAEVARFEEWALHSVSAGEGAAREALTRITSLYMAGLQLPSSSAEEAEYDESVTGLPDGIVANVKGHSGVPFDYYGVVFSPQVIPHEEPVIGSLDDDVRDIFRDVVTGLRAFESGDRNGALWEWRERLQDHWGRHAVGAIRSLHIWIAENAPESLLADD